MRAALVAALLVGCAQPEVTALCLEAPVVTWDNFAAGFVAESCQSCHASTSEDRNGAPSDVVFDTEEETLAFADRILARSTGDDPDMPPQGGVVDADRYYIEVWLSCE